MICSRCKVEKSENQFITGKTKCLKCYQYAQKYYKDNRQKEIERAKKHLNKDREKTNAIKRAGIRKNPVSYLLWNIKARAKKNGILFNLDHSDICIPEKCPIFGVTLTISEGSASSSSPSVDRINPKLGYVKGNIQVISHRANSIKNDATIDELKQLVNYLESLPLPTNEFFK